LSILDLLILVKDGIISNEAKLPPNTQMYSYPAFGRIRGPLRRFAPAVKELKL
jgi:hypothetical protein